MSEVPVFTAERIKRFLEEKPLLTWERDQLPGTESQIDVVSIDMYCRACKMVRPFITLASRGGGAGGVQPMGRPADETARYRKDPRLTSTIVEYSFQCAGCPGRPPEKYYFWVEIDVQRQAIRKLGQNPPYTIEIDKSIEDFLGEDGSEFFKRGRVCELQGYGIGAYAYYRRVVEDCISGFIDKLRDIFVLQSVDKLILDRLHEAESNRQMETRISIIKDILPNHLRPGGVNPIQVIYDAYSAGIHRLSEEQCVEYADDIRRSLIYLIRTLSNIKTEQMEYIQTIRKLQDRQNRNKGDQIQGTQN